MNFLKNGFRKHGNVANQQTVLQPATLESKKEAQGEHKDLELFMAVENDDQNCKYQEKFADADAIIMEFSDKNVKKNGKSAKDDRAAQVAFETNSSIASENCSIDSIQIDASVPQSGLQ